MNKCLDLLIASVEWQGNEEWTPLQSRLSCTCLKIHHLWLNYKGKICLIFSVNSSQVPFDPTKCLTPAATPPAQSCRSRKAHTHTHTHTRARARADTHTGGRTRSRTQIQQIQIQLQWTSIRNFYFILPCVVMIAGWATSRCSRSFPRSGKLGLCIVITLGTLFSVLVNELFPEPSDDNVGVACWFREASRLRIC